MFSLFISKYVTMFWLLVSLLTLSLVTGVKRSEPVKSSLFQSWAEPPPYMMYPNYMQPGFAPEYMQQRYAPPYPYPPMNYYPQAPPPPPGYFQQQYQPYPYGYQPALQAASPPPVVVEYQTPPVLTERKPAVEVKEPEAAVPPIAQSVEPVQAVPQTTPSPMKAALSKAMNDAMKQMDKVTDSALDLSTFDNLHYSAPAASRPPVRMSLSEETVPLDSHILNWRELVGLPART